VAFPVVLDACVLYPAYLRDTLLTLAEAGLYRPLWSAEIINEMRRNLIANGVVADSVDRVIGEMHTAFPLAEVVGYEHLVESVICDHKDRHVLAAAAHSGAVAIVTFNVKDFPANGFEVFDLEVIQPDDFLLDALDLRPVRVLAALDRQVTHYRRQPTTIAGLMDVLARCGVPGFADEIRRMHP
jgi:predicted nucleic acid-binding protein